MSDHDWETGVDKAVGHLRPEPPAMSEQAYATGLALLRATIDAEDQGAVIIALPATSAPGPLAKRPRPFSLVAAISVLAVAAVVAVVGISIIQPTSEVPVATENPMLPVNAAGDIADHVRDLPLRPGEYLYVKRDLLLGDGIDNETRALRPGLIEEWIPFDRSQNWQQTADTDLTTKTTKDPIPPKYLVSGVSAQEGTLVAPGGNYEDIPDKWTGGNPGQRYYDNLPDDPALLYRQVLQHKPGGDLDLPGMFGEFETMLGRSLRAGQRATVLRAMAYLPGLSVVNTATSPDGHPATRLSVEIPGNHDEVVRLQQFMSPVDGTLTGGGVVSIRGGMERTISQASITYAVVSSRGARP
ncbi:hypothetical protein [Amycolatopsis sp. H20-H5]|uniref:hypothetical protein n=1 Tax=Amycolatopsis sp. H20-H5 TaxID=3046309 RepID=UPI002DB9D449|nr:hypothetical protein [Amycolatopsis sp. H20-H5]MEC3981776.1 hypothetical protein [Amycolatopsis sp. H20-H5]